jgi:hypothetical protein
MTRRLRNFGTSHDSRERGTERGREREKETEQVSIGVQAEYVIRVKHLMFYRAFLCIPMGILLKTPNPLIITVHIPAVNFVLQIPGYNVQQAY